MRTARSMANRDISALPFSVSIIAAPASPYFAVPSDAAARVQPAGLVAEAADRGYSPSSGRTKSWSSMTISSSARVRPAARWQRGSARIQRTRSCSSRRARRSHPYSRMPLCFGLLIHNPAANWLYQSEPEAGTANRKSRCRAANCSADRARSTGSSGCAASRSTTIPGRRWATAAGAGSDVAPVFTRIENYEGGDGTTAAAPTARSRSRSCPIRTRSTTRCSRPAKAAGFKLNPDYNSEDQEGIVQDADQHPQGPAHERRALLPRAGDEAAEPARDRRRA